MVVFGILIALQVNNFNEQHKTDIKENQYLKSIKSELLTNLTLVKKEVEGKGGKCAVLREEGGVVGGKEPGNGRRREEERQPTEELER